MRKLKLILPVLGVLSLGLLVGCHPDPVDPQNTEYKQASSSFTVLTALSTNLDDNKAIDFTTDSLRFQAEFSEEVSWKIVISGSVHEEDHAVKTIEGTSNVIDLDTDFWAGESDNIYFFKEGEELNIEFSCLGCDEETVSTSLDSFSVEETKVFNDVLILNFEGEGALLNSIDDVNIFYDPNEGANENMISIGKFATVESLSEFDLPTPVQGYKFLYMNGTDNVSQPGSFFIGGFNNNAKKFGLEGDASEWYLNFYANSNGNTTTKIIPKITGVGGDAFTLERNITWDGWRLISIRLSDFIQSEAGAIGTGILEPALIKQVIVELHSGGGGPGNQAEVLIDYVTFTKDAPFSQSN